MLDLWNYRNQLTSSLDGPDYYAYGGAIDFFIDEQRGLPLGNDRGEQIGGLIGQGLQQLLFPDYGGGQTPPILPGPMSEQLGVNDPFDPLLKQLPRINLGGLEIEIGNDDPAGRNPFAYPVPARAPDANYPTVEYQTRKPMNSVNRFGGCGFSLRVFKWLAPYLVRSGVLVNRSPGVQWSQEAVLVAYQWWLSNGQPCPRRKKMNPLNPSALKRAVRRLAGFQKFQKSTEKVLRKMVPASARGRGRGFAGAICANCRKSPCGCR